MASRSEAVQGHPTNGIVSGARVASFEEVHLKATRIASILLANGVKAGDSVALLMRNDIPFIAISYAIAKIGAYAVPVNWHSTPGDILYILQDCNATVLFAHADLLDPIVDMVSSDIAVVSLATPPDLCAAYGIDTKRASVREEGTDFDRWIETHVADADFSTRKPFLSMIYTSGTTGRPKGVRRFPPTPDEQSAMDAVRHAVLGVRDGMRALVPGPLYHSAPNAFALRVGCHADCLNLMPRFDAEEMLRVIEQERIDTILMVPTMFIRMLKLPEEVRARYDLSSLKYVVHAAAPCSVETKQQMIDWLGPIIWEYYGGTETGILTLVSSEEALRKPGTVGRAAPYVDLRILDDEGNIVSQGQVGEIFSRVEPSADFTYQNAPEKRAEIERDGYLTGGDVGYLDENGYLFLCDRKRDMVISGGVNIYPAEIEAVLQKIAGVRDCAVFGIPDPEFGESLVAAVELDPGSSHDEKSLRAELKGLIASYKVPRRVEIHASLPREDSGKIFKRKLRDPYWEKAGRRI